MIWLLFQKGVVINVSGQSVCCHDKQSAEEDVAACTPKDFDSLGTFCYCNHHTYCGCNLSHSVEEWCNFCWLIYSPFCTRTHCGWYSPFTGFLHHLESTTCIMRLFKCANMWTNIYEPSHAKKALMVKIFKIDFLIKNDRLQFKLTKYEIWAWYRAYLLRYRLSIRK